MPRKRSDFNPGVYAFKGWASLDKSMTPGAKGFYPSNRRFGSSVFKTVIEKWNQDSKWCRWKKGTTIYGTTYWSKIVVANQSYDPGLEEQGSNIPYVPASIASTLYKGTNFAYNLAFSGYEFPTSNADGNNYYTVRRIPTNLSGGQMNLGTVSTVYNEIYNSDGTYTTNYLANEIKVDINTPHTTSRALLHLIGDRITDGDLSTVNRTEATLKNVLLYNGKPTIYKGRTLSETEASASTLNRALTNITVTIDVADVNVTNNSGTFVPNQGVNSAKRDVKQSSINILENPELLAGNIVYIQDFFVDMSISALTSSAFVDDDYFVEFSFVEDFSSQTITGLEADVNELPPSTLDLANLPTIFTTTAGAYKLSGSYAFRKSDYQSYFGSTYFTDQTLQNEVVTISSPVSAFTVLKADIVNNGMVDQLIIDAVPYESTIELHPDFDEYDLTLVFDSGSFTNSYPKAGKTYLNTDINPFTDEIFAAHQPLRPAIGYTCSCPSFSKAILSMPQSYQTDSERKVNRQLRYPIPSAQSTSTYDAGRLNEAAGKIASWAEPSYKFEYKLCKHVVAAMLNDGYIIREPDSHPTIEQRETFEAKLNQDLIQMQETYNIAYKRSGISLSEVVFSLGQGMNLDNTEIAYVVLNSTPRGT
tara:strand:+ start:140 stop:2077 length:1938 start_codon:yes stop_codon:yes gene_type:complete